MNKTAETIRSRLHISDDEINTTDPLVVEELAAASDQAIEIDGSTPGKEPTNPESDSPRSDQADPCVSASEKEVVKVDKKSTPTKDVIVTNYPYPKNWIPEGASEMQDNIKPIADERFVDARKRSQEPTVITLPTMEKNVTESFSDVSVDPVVERISTVIAVNCTNTGDIKSKDGVMIQGTQVGNISIDTEDLDPTGTIVVTKAGTVRGQIEGKRVVVLGRVEGSIKSYTHVTLGESAVVTGDVEYKTIRMMDGAEIEGNCRKLKDEG
ncbi:hypothetical protein CL689_03635 [Candidatus Saccharibacteria bacterium]|nr:hypothetical protein [Candidatus Saccharibacteria bacterium]|tara:strand:- start:428 stop:1231 length:804 start_codon:yes stop_codon:yes gene_type:complete